jgi:hypothetical protein
VSLVAAFGVLSLFKTKGNAEIKGRIQISVLKSEFAYIQNSVVLLFSSVT